MFGNNKRKQFEKLFQPHLDAAYNLARHLCGNAYDAEDIVQEAYIRAYRAFGNYSNDNSRAWILTITRNTCYSWMRRHSMDTGISFDEDIHTPVIDDQRTNAAVLRPMEKLIDDEDNKQLIRHAIESLPVEFREVTILRELEELTYQEISTVLGIPKGTVMSRLARARNRLREILSDLNEWQ